MQASYLWFYLSLLANALCLSAMTTTVHHQVSKNKELKALSGHMNFSFSFFFICLAIIVGMFAGETFIPSSPVTNPLEFCLLIFKLPEEISLLLVVVLAFVVAYPLWNNRQIIVKSQNKERADTRDKVKAAKAILNSHESLQNVYSFVINHPDIPVSIKEEIYKVASLSPEKFRDLKKKSKEMRYKKQK